MHMPDLKIKIMYCFQARQIFKFDFAVCKEVNQKKNGCISISIILTPFGKVTIENRDSTEIERFH